MAAAPRRLARLRSWAGDGTGTQAKASNQQPASRRRARQSGATQSKAGSQGRCCWRHVTPVCTACRQSLPAQAAAAAAPAIAPPHPAGNLQLQVQGATPRFVPFTRAFPRPGPVPRRYVPVTTPHGGSRSYPPGYGRPTGPRTSRDGGCLFSLSRSLSRHGQLPPSSWPGAFPFGSGKVWCGCAGPVQPDVRVLACMCCVADGRPGRDPLRGGGWCAVADRRRMAIMSGREKMDSLACHRQILPTTVNRPGRPAGQARSGLGS